MHQGAECLKDAHLEFPLKGATDLHPLLLVTQRGGHTTAFESNPGEVVAQACEYLIGCPTKPHFQGVGRWQRNRFDCIWHRKVDAVMQPGTLLTSINSNAEGSWKRGSRINPSSPPGYAPSLWHHQFIRSSWSTSHAEPTQRLKLVQPLQKCSVRRPSVRLDRLGTRPNSSPPPFSLLPPPNDSRAPSPTSSNPGPTCAGRPCRFGPGVSETTPVQCHARAVIGGVALERNTSTAVRVRQSRLKAQATQGGYVPRQIVAEVPNLPTTSCSGGLPIDENRLFSSLLGRMRRRLRPERRDPGFSCPAVPASGPLAPVGYRPGLLRSLPRQVAPRYSQSQSQRQRTRQRRRTYYGTSHTWGLPSPRRLFILPSRPTRAATSRIRTWPWWQANVTLIQEPMPIALEGKTQARCPPSHPSYEMSLRRDSTERTLQAFYEDSVRSFSCVIQWSSTSGVRLPGRGAVRSPQSFDVSVAAWKRENFAAPRWTIRKPYVDSKTPTMRCLARRLVGTSPSDLSSCGRQFKLNAGPRKERQEEEQESQHCTTKTEACLFLLSYENDAVHWHYSGSPSTLTPP
ncbi:hypothetical protein CPAR01_12623 [Colletotrichum paranaense]|uniref:Uncharacterized protein n=1 Tax=Colletotrichum paranaense TaxID=1914294 RepID=A0ABQ9S6X3_9PEZI|nr:uncharacterized protein CPAR01_12623 [Colletotrichum paranaense]KAK1528065.1 hypothetical protein CPAR01_12623 [Colletotrichum paranaense]